MKLSMGERERRLSTIPIAFRAALQDPLLYAHLETLLKAPTWDPEAVVTWLLLAALADRRRLAEELRKEQHLRRITETSLDLGG